ncbi:hypothetical protein PV04_04514 [Phialophora macrospora]|uniref:Heterokaryon incompatibility domain-containing protein n=1 Tax=Phialophora macrospora TaxID=1851006 RepID=A0A0D2CTR7_9EURO|nr:hypothetical protein PV04_04514 [Phialophora macrospora]
MFNWFNGSNRLRPNRKSQPRCSDFERLEATIREARHQRKSETEFIKLHSSYEDLEQCARNGCTGCRVVRQGLLLAQITGRQVQQLENRDDPVYIRMQSGHGKADGVPSHSLLHVILGTPQQPLTGVNIALTSNIDRPRLPGKKLDLVVPQLEKWLNNCVVHHEAQCGRLSWSKENPRRLIEILSDSEVKLIDASQYPRLDYAALSYCWGDGAKDGNTTWDNLTSRQTSLAMETLPETIRDSLLLVRRLGLRYMWIDQLCIVQPTEDTKGEDWDLEGSRMHIVYGNALFTLNACSSETSIDGLFRPRKAWTYPVFPFYLEGQWLVNFDVSLKEVRARAPLSARAWVLQEERLSPRLLYFCSQRFYWSCVVEQHMELAAESGERDQSVSRPLARGGDYEWLSDAQAFLNVRFNGDKDPLHKEWQDLVESYCQRDMTKSSDRFRAISGLAAQYLRVYLNSDNQFSGQEYLAGLWRETFAEDLAWSVRIAKDPRKALMDLAPSWSWASLPLCSRISTKEPFASTKEKDDFVLLEDNETASRAKDPDLDSEVVVLEACRQGADKKSAFVKGRLQSIMNKKFKQVDWSEIHVNYGHLDNYIFTKYIDQYVYARDPNSGKIVIHEPTKRSMVGQLDYLVPSDEVDDSNPRRHIHVEVGTEKELYGLQIGRKIMLLLQSQPTSDSSGAGKLSAGIRQGLPIYRRVGLCRNVRDTFFDGIELSELELR